MSITEETIILLEEERTTEEEIEELQKELENYNDYYLEAQENGNREAEDKWSRVCWDIVKAKERKEEHLEEINETMTLLKRKYACEIISQNLHHNDEEETEECTFDFESDLRKEKQQKLKRQKWEMEERQRRRENSIESKW